MATAAPTKALRTVYVRNLPRDATEAQLREFMKLAGPVVYIRIPTDAETGRSKGYGFCEYPDHETALSAIRHMNDREFGGRVISVNFADTDRVAPNSAGGRKYAQSSSVGAAGAAAAAAAAPASAAPLPPGAAPSPYAAYPPNAAVAPQQVVPPQGGGPPPPGYAAASPYAPAPAPLPTAPVGPAPGAAYTLGAARYRVPPPLSSLEALRAFTLSLTRDQCIDLLLDTKRFIQENPDGARQLLLDNPNLAHVLLQLQVKFCLVKPSDIEAIQRASIGPGGTTTALVPPVGAPAPIAGVPPPVMYPYGAPAAPYGVPPAVAAAAAVPPSLSVAAVTAAPGGVAPGADMASKIDAILHSLPPEQQEVLRRLLQCTPEEVAMLPPEQQESIRAILAQLV